MNEIRELILPDSYEEVKSALGGDVAKMPQFVVPVREAEEGIALAAHSVKFAGHILLLLGRRGIGKSTFIQSLSWRLNLAIPEVIEIDAEDLRAQSGDHSDLLSLLHRSLREIVDRAKSSKNPKAVLTVVISHLENLERQSESDIKAFLRDINGFLRKNALLVIWPVTDKKDAGSLLNYADSVSDTIFVTHAPILEFRGPPVVEFPKIAKDTIAVLNPGLSLDDFLLSDTELELMAENFKQRNESEITIRNYLREVLSSSQKKSGELKRVVERLPRATEVWFIVCHDKGEDVARNFSRKTSHSIDDRWDAEYDGVYEYVAQNIQNHADWPKTERLQFAIRGKIRTKVMFLQTNALISCICAYGRSNGVSQELIDKLVAGSFDHWKNPSTTKRLLASSPMIRQLKGESEVVGKQRGGRHTESIDKASPLFPLVSASTYGEGSDVPFNKCLAQAMRDVMQVGDDMIAAEQYHPFLPGIRTDILVNLNPNKHICIEIHYSAKTQPSELGNYILRKLDRYTGLSLKF
jgi:hypothetical protein